MDKDMDAFAAGVVFEHGERVREDVLDLLAVGELGVDHGRGAAARANRVEGGRRGLGVAEDEDDVGAGLGEREGDCGADACLGTSRQFYLCICVFVYLFIWHWCWAGLNEPRDAPVTRATCSGRVKRSSEGSWGVCRAAVAAVPRVVGVAGVAGVGIFK